MGHAFKVAHHNGMHDAGAETLSRGIQGSRGHQDIDDTRPWGQKMEEGSAPG